MSKFEFLKSFPRFPQVASIYRGELVRGRKPTRESSVEAVHLVKHWDCPGGPFTWSFIRNSVDFLKPPLIGCLCSDVILESSASKNRKKTTVNLIRPTCYFCGSDKVPKRLRVDFILVSFENGCCRYLAQLHFAKCIWLVVCGRASKLLCRLKWLFGSRYACLCQSWSSDS